MATIHPTAIVAAGAELDSDVSIGAYSIIGPRVRIGARSVIGPHTVIDGVTSLGCDNRVGPHVSLGGPPQDKKYRGEETRLEIGDRNTIREFSTYNTGTAQDVGVTRLGNDNWMMAYTHLAHDCQVGNNTIFANNAQIAGHVHVGDWVILGAYTAVHQFVKIGPHAMTGMGSILTQDLPPFVMASGNTAAPHGLNSEGLKRRGFTPATVTTLRNAYKTIYKSGLSLADAIAALEAQTADAATEAETRPHLAALVAFLRASSRGIVR